MADQSLKIPEVDKQSTEAPGNKAQETKQETSQPDTSSHYIGTKEIVISAGAVLAAAVVCFVVKNYISKMLVSSYKKSPQSADMAGWGLFCVLLLTAIISVLGGLDSSKFMALPYLIAFGIAIVVSLVVFIMALASKR